MPRFAFINELNLIANLYDERIDDDGLMTHLLDLYDHPDFVPGMDELACFLKTTEARVTAEGLRQVASTFPRRRERARPNFVAAVTASQLGYGLSRLYGAHAESRGVTMEVFGDVRVALDWIDQRRQRPPGTAYQAAARLLPDLPVTSS